MNAVIIFYSKSGTTGKLAERIQGVFGGEMIAVKTAEPYGSYASAVLRYGKEKKAGIVPEYIAPKLGLEDVDTVFVGYPIWYSEAPSFLRAYLSGLDLRGKTVIPFSTSGMSHINVTLAGLDKAVKCKTVLPYSCGLFFKDDFGKWVERVKERYRS